MSGVRFCHFCHCRFEYMDGTQAYCSKFCRLEDHRPGWAWASKKLNPNTPDVAVLRLWKMNPDKSVLGTQSRGES